MAHLAHPAKPALSRTGGVSAGAYELRAKTHRTFEIFYSNN